MYIMQDIIDTKGILKAVSTSKDSYRDICILKKELADNNIDCALLGSYNTSKIGILNINWGNYKSMSNYIPKLDDTTYIWNPWHGCKQCSIGCQHCYLFANDMMSGSLPLSESAVWTALLPVELWKLYIL